jgi:hypothetical protein
LLLPVQGWLPPTSVTFILTNSDFLRNLMRGRRHASAAGWSA